MGAETVGNVRGAPTRGAGACGGAAVGHDGAAVESDGEDACGDGEDAGHDGEDVGHDGTAAGKDGGLEVAADTGWTSGTLTTGKAGGRISGIDGGADTAGRRFGPVSASESTSSGPAGISRVRCASSSSAYSRRGLDRLSSPRLSRTMAKTRKASACSICSWHTLSSTRCAVSRCPCRRRVRPSSTSSAISAFATINVFIVPACVSAVDRQPRAGST